MIRHELRARRQRKQRWSWLKTVLSSAFFFTLGNRLWHAPAVYGPENFIPDTPQPDAGSSSVTAVHEPQTTQFKRDVSAENDVSQDPSGEATNSEDKNTSGDDADNQDKKPDEENDNGDRSGEASEAEDGEKKTSDDEKPNAPWIDLTVEVADWDYIPYGKPKTVKDPELNLDPEKCSNLVVDRSPPKRRAPSKGACNGYDGIIQIKHGDVGAASGTVFFLYMVGMLTWAEQHNYLPWVHMNDFSVKIFDKDVHTQGSPFTMTMMDGMEVGWARDDRDPIGYKFPGKPTFSDGVTELTRREFEFEGTGIWEHYFEPVNQFSPGDPSCTDKPFLIFDDYHLMPGFHSQAPWAPRGWRYWMPAYIQKIDLPLQEWFAPQRELGAAITDRYIRFNADMEQRAACALPNPENSLGLHIGHGDKGLEREIVPVSDFLLYAKAFIDNEGGSIYLATDSTAVVEEIMRDWPERVTSHIVRQASVEAMTSNDTAAFDLGVSNHQSNIEALTDLRALSKCTYLIHGLSALTEAVMFLNPELVHRALNLDDPDQTKDVDYFVGTIIPNGKIPNYEYADLSLPVATWEYFPEINEVSVKERKLNLNPKNCSKLVVDRSPPPKRPPSKGACEGYDGILHISNGDLGGASGAIFFQFVVGFLQWADQHNYKPWIHLNDITVPIYDEVVHAQGEGVKFNMMSGMIIGDARDARDPHGYRFPGAPKMREGVEELTPETYEFPGTGIWDHYFEPVSDFVPGDRSCENKPLVTLNYVPQIVPGIHSQAPWAPRAWRYWMPPYIQLMNITEQEWFAPQRRRAAETVKRYIRFTPEMEQRAACAHPNPENSLGMHIRHGDKWTTRNVIPVSDFLMFCEAYVDRGLNGTIFLATDSQLVVDEIMREWPERVKSRIVQQKAMEGLSKNESAAFSIGVSKHRTNVEALTDALALSKCKYLLHGLSALSEAAMYLNPGLVKGAVNLEDWDVDRDTQLERFKQEVLQQRIEKREEILGMDANPVNSDDNPPVLAKSEDDKEKKAVKEEAKHPSAKATTSEDIDKKKSGDDADEEKKQDETKDNEDRPGEASEPEVGTKNTSEDNSSNPEWISLTIEVADWDFTPDGKPKTVKDPEVSLDPQKCSNLVVDRSPPKRRPPSKGACDGYDGIIQLKHGDVGGASGTVFFLYMVGMLTWAEQHNYLPWVHMNDFSVKIFDKDVHTQGSPFTMTMMDGMEVGWARDDRDPIGYKFPGKPMFSEGVTELSRREFEFEGTGIWEHYFEPVNQFSPGDPSCTDKPFLIFDDYHLMPGLHSHAPWAPHGWRYWMPAYIQKIDLPLQEWFAPQRKLGAAITDRYIRFNADMEQRAACALPNPENSLGLHIRHGDKGLEREIVPVSDFLPYAKAFIDNEGGSIYLATDSTAVVEEIMRDWPERVTSHIVRQASVEAMTSNDTAAFDLGVSNHQSNIEALTDLRALSKCTYLIHGLSALTEAVMFLNPELVHRALNLDDPDQTKDVDYFVGTIIPNGKIPNYEYADLSLPVATWEYFPEINEVSVKERKLNLNPKNCSKLVVDRSPPPKRPPSKGACEGYDGILHISNGDLGGASGAIFFQFVVGFLQWADQHNYKPWIHLNDITVPIYDEVVHAQGEGVKFNMMSGMIIGDARDARDPHGYRFPGAPKMREGVEELTPETYEFPGTGIWDHYFEPVSDFVPGDPSCEKRPLVAFDLVPQIVPGIHSQAPWAPHAWRYWMPDYIQLRNITELAWFEPQRRHAAETVKRYIRFTPEMEQRAACAHPNPENSMGMHIRHGDKWTTRWVIPVSDFLSFCEAYVDRVSNGTIFLATDSQLVVDEIMREWPERVKSRIVQQKAMEGLSKNESAAFSIGVSKHRTNVEALTDALALSKCKYLLHGLSALSEAAMYLNPELAKKAANLEDWDVATFKQLKRFKRDILPPRKNER